MIERSVSRIFATDIPGCVHFSFQIDDKVTQCKEFSLMMYDYFYFYVLFVCCF